MKAIAGQLRTMSTLCSLYKITIYPAPKVASEIINLFANMKKHKFILCYFGNPFSNLYFPSSSSLTKKFLRFSIVSIFFHIHLKILSVSRTSSNIYIQNNAEQNTRRVTLVNTCIPTTFALFPGLSIALFILSY